MIVGQAEIVLVIVLMIFCTAAGALASSLLNHKQLKKMERDMEHMRNNTKAIKQAVEAQSASHKVR